MEVKLTGITYTVQEADPFKCDVLLEGLKADDGSPVNKTVVGEDYPTDFAVLLASPVVSDDWTIVN